MTNLRAMSMARSRHLIWRSVFGLILIMIVALVGIFCPEIGAARAPSFGVNDVLLTALIIGLCIQSSFIFIYDGRGICRESACICRTAREADRCDWRIIFG
jgi:hypothetical protein